MKRLALLLAFSVASPSATATTIYFGDNALGSKEQPYVIDLSKKSTISIPSSNAKEIYIQINYMLPSFLEEYSISFSEQTTSLQPFDRNSIQHITPTTPSKTTAGFTGCSIDFSEEVNGILDANDENSDFVLKVNNLKEKISKAQQEQSCASDVKSAQKLLDQTRQQVRVVLDKNSEVEIKVSRSNASDNLAQINILHKRTEWMTHVGFTFINNKDEQFFTKQNSAGDYIITPMDDDSNYLYAATILFTYPFWMNDSNNFGAGLSAGLGATSENVLLTVGPSLIIAENLIFNFGATVTPFERLKGIYNSGQNVGENPIDSSALSDSKYDITWSFTLGYRFN